MLYIKQAHNYYAVAMFPKQEPPAGTVPDNFARDYMLISAGSPEELENRIEADKTAHGGDLQSLWKSPSLNAKMSAVIHIQMNEFRTELRELAAEGVPEEEARKTALETHFDIEYICH